MFFFGFCDLRHQLLRLLEVARPRAPRRVGVDRVEARHALRREAGRRDLVRLRDVVDDRLAVDRERHRPPLVHVGDVLDVEAVVVGAERRVLLVVLGVSLSRGISAGGRPGVSTSTSPASNACTAVVPSDDHGPLTRVSVTSVGVAPPSHLTRSMSRRAPSASSLNGPFVTMFCGLGPLVAELLDRLLVARRGTSGAPTAGRTTAAATSASPRACGRRPP